MNETNWLRKWFDWVNDWGLTLFIGLAMASAVLSLIFAFGAAQETRKRRMEAYLPSAEVSEAWCEEYRNPTYAFQKELHKIRLFGNESTRMQVDEMIAECEAKQESIYKD